MYPWRRSDSLPDQADIPQAHPGQDPLAVGALQPVAPVFLIQEDPHPLMAGGRLAAGQPQDRGKLT